MKERGMSWGKLSRLTELSRPTLYRLARGEGNPSFRSYIVLAECLGTSLTNLLGPQVGVERSEERGAMLVEPLLSDPPRGDPRAKTIYEEACRGASEDDLEDLANRINFPFPGEDPEDSISRAILDVFDRKQAWIDHHRIRRDEDLERKIYKEFNLPVRMELEDPIPVRVIDIKENILPMVQIHAVAVMAAALVKEFSRRYRVLGFADGFVVSTIQKFLLRGDLQKTELVPLIHSPRFAQFELSGATLIGSLARKHQGYQVRSTIELSKLQERIGEVQVAVTSCGSVMDRSPFSRLPRLMREASPGVDFGAFMDELKRQGAVGDLLYHFLGADGKWLKDIQGVAHDIESASLRTLMTAPKGDVAIYSVSPDGMVRIAKRGVCIIVAFNEGRAALARAALLRRAVNFLVLTKAAANALLKKQEPPQKAVQARREGRKAGRR
jgi:DNA-binding transcriptional regulator LsrR (DeoR family)